jgi:hypothetical protein
VAECDVVRPGAGVRVRRKVVCQARWLVAARGCLPSAVVGGGAGLVAGSAGCGSAGLLAWCCRVVLGAEARPEAS